MSTPRPTPTQTVIIGEQPVFERKRNKKGKPTGKAALAGFALDFGVPLNSAAAESAASYQVDTVTTKKVKKKKETLLQPITNITPMSCCPGERGGRHHARVPGDVSNRRPAHGLGRPDDRVGRYAERDRGLHHLQGWEEYWAVVSPVQLFGLAYAALR